MVGKKENGMRVLTFVQVLAKLTDQLFNLWLVEVISEIFPHEEEVNVGICKRIMLTAFRKNLSSR